LDWVSTQLYEQHSREFGVSRETTTTCLDGPDKVQDVTYSGLELRLFLGKEKDRDSHLLILAQIKDGKLHLLLPFRVPRSLFPNIQVLEPLMILELLAQEYGYVLGIGDRLGRFIYQQEVPIPKGVQDIPSLSQLVRILNPNNHDCVESIFISPRGNVAKCALAFCLDKTLYTSGLACGIWSRVSVSRSSRPITRIIGPDLVRRTVGETVNKVGTEDIFNIIELRLALLVTRELMGNQWYETVMREFPKAAKISDKDYQRIVKSQEVHPLSEALWSGKPENYIRLISFAHYLNQLWRKDDSNKLSEKTKELKQYSFMHAYYELKVAAFFDKKGFGVSFIKKEKDLRTADFRIDSVDGFAFGECKRKDATSLQIDSDVEEAALQIQEYGWPGIIFLEVLPKVDDASAKGMLDRGSMLLEGKNRVSLLIVTNEQLREEIGTWMLGTKVWGIENETALTRLPVAIRNAALFQDPIRWLPLSQTVEEVESSEAER